MTMEDLLDQKFAPINDSLENFESDISSIRKSIASRKKEKQVIV